MFKKKLFGQFLLFLIVVSSSGLSSAVATEHCPSCTPPPSSGDAFPELRCEGEALSYEEACRLFPPGNNRVHVGKFTYLLKTRNCSEYTGCSAWSLAPVVLGWKKEYVEYDRYGRGSVSVQYYPDSGIQGGNVGLTMGADGVRVHFESDATWIGEPESNRTYLQKSAPFKHAAGRLEGETSLIPVLINHSLVPTVEVQGAGTIRMTRNCAYFKSRQFRDGNAEKWTEYQLAAEASF